MFDIFEKIVDWDNIIESYNNTQKSPPKYKESAIKFAQDDIANLRELKEEIIAQEYYPKPYNKFYVYEPKMRTIYSPSYRDKIVQHMVYRILREIYEPSFIHDSFSCIRGRGNQRAVDKLQKYMNKGNWYFNYNSYIVKADIQKFFPSINREILKQILRKKIKCIKTLDLCDNIIDSSPPDKGLPLGNLTSQLFANVFLNELDQFVKHNLKEKFYIRYSDDIFIVTESKKRGKFLNEELKQFASNHLDLVISEEKSFVRKTEKGIDSLGFKVFPKYKLLNSKSKNKLKRKLNSVPKRLLNGERKQKLEQELNSSLAFIQQSNCLNFLKSLNEKYDYVFLKLNNKNNYNFKINRNIALQKYTPGSKK